ncbi:EAL domain-containing protein [Parasphingopyxis sp. CP4]|uniref:putative bifunctional diguanylate cyclase/phosphodiesterase n=1 Tax=Parasphingopyxis sp. CP4 TaxID=2724527 RepID=UPI0015A1B45B|nr:EAL domain-containing protein [Parasphingopyxis sp. CP4]QLC20802.1 EAL domain-containing protein [Parasphingopyxis sp. CP4]
MPTLGGKLRHLAASESSLARQVRAALVSTLYTSPASLAIGAIAGSVTAACIAYVTGSLALLICSIAIHLVGILRIASAIIYLRGNAKGSPREQLHWERIYEIGAWLYASLLGAQAFFTLTNSTNTVILLMATIMATGYSAGVAARNAGRPVIAIGQLCLGTLPMALGLFLMGTALSITLGLCIVIFVLGMVDISLQIYEVVYTALSGKQEKSEVAARFEKMARSDMLTGLDNRLAMQMRLGDLLDDIGDLKTEKLAVIWMDLDHFKTINDTLGHLAGDKVLIVTAQRVKAVLGDRGWLARFGGDEFVIMGLVDSADEAELLGNEILESVSQPVSINDNTVEVAASLGVAVAPDHGIQSEVMLKNADIALYHSKNEGGKCVRIFEPFMHEDFLLHRQIESGLTEAMAKDQFTVLFQPIIDLATGRTRSCEALLRWNHPELGDVSPAVFIPVAESAGLIGDITEWVLRKSCEAAAEWPEEVNVSVNISPALLKQNNLPVKIIETLVNTGMVARRLELEITESVLLDKNPHTNSLLRQLQKMGLRLCLDDFGTGFSSLTYLRSWEFDTIKIDKSFIRNIGNSPTDQKIIRAVVQLAKSLEVATVAEGVETEEQLARVRDAGCSRVQGFYYARPMTAPQAQQRLAMETVSNAADPQIVNLR